MTNGGAGEGEGPGWVGGGRVWGGAGGGGSVEREKAVGEQTRPLVICGPSTLSLPWTHLSSSGVIGGEVETGAVAAAAAAPQHKMLYNDSHFPPLSSSATAATAACAGSPAMERNGTGD